MNTLKFGFIGAGRMGQYHAKVLAGLGGRARVAAVADVMEGRAEQLAREYGAQAYQDYRAMLDCEDLDALFILTPPAVRLEPVQLACEKKMAVFCEKPPALNLVEAQQIADLLDGSGVVNSVGFMYRWYRSVGKARELLAGRAIGCVQSIFLCGVALDPAQPKWTFIQENAGGPLLEQAIHSLDAIRYLAGDISKVVALGGNPILPKNEAFTIEDSHALGLQFASGAVGTHLHSWVHRKPIVQVRIFGVDFDLTVDLVSSGSLIGALNGEVVDFRPEANHPYQTQLIGFVEAVEKRDQSLIRSSYRDAVQSLAATLQAMEAVARAEIQ